MKNVNEKKKLHHKAYHHVRRHKKKYVRFIAFFIFLVIYSIIEDLIAIKLHGIELNTFVIFNIVLIAMIFTLISEVTEGLYRKEEPKIEKLMKKEGKMIKKEERIIKKKMKL